MRLKSSNHKRLITSCLGLLLVAGYSAFGQDLEFKKLGLDRAVSKTIATLTESEKKESGVVLKEKNVMEYAFDEKGNLQRYYGTYRRIHLNESRAVESYNKIVLPIQSNSELLMIKARAIRKNGTVKEVGLEAVKELEEEGRIYKILAVEGLEVGGEIDFYFLFRSSPSMFGAEFMQESVPIRESEFRIISPDFLIYEAKVYNGPAVKADTVETEEKRILTFQAKNLSATYNEKYATSDANRTRIEYKLAYNERKGPDRMFTWNDAGERMYQFLQVGNEESMKEISKFLSKEKIKGLSEETAIKAVENYIKTNIALKEDAEEDIAANVLKRRFGNQTGIIRLYLSMYKALNIPYEVVIGCSRYERTFDKYFDSWNYLDKYLIFFPNTQKYLDPENPFYRYGLFNATLEGTDALYISTVSSGKVNTGVATIEKIPVTTAAVNYDNLELEVNFPATMDRLEMQFAKIMGGQQAAQFRPYYFLGNEEQRTKMAGEYLKYSLKEDAVIADVKVSNFNINSEEVNKECAISASVSLKSVLERADKRILFKVGELIGPQMEMYNERPRQHPIDVGMVHAYNRKLKINLPEGYKVSGLDKLKRNLIFGEGKTMGFVSDYTQEGKVLTITIHEFYNQLTYPFSAYDNFQKVINAAADFNKVTLILEKEQAVARN